MYLACLVAAPVLTTYLGLVPVGPGLAAPAGTAVSALTTWARGAAIDAYGRSVVLLMWLPGSVLAALLAPASLVVATVLAFFATELVTAAAWKALRPHGKWAVAGAVLAAGVVIDIVTYAAIAGLPIAAVTLGKLVAKVWIAAVVGAAGLMMCRFAGSARLR
ncbi:hypothetical protein ACIG3E_33525 [Streptomyces sp. NPDC053474]|uniref:hypothetical protein n=1 Tax=Streptomyces sp. NPDC053474 TaxID=3365704 RepID=UPI0037D00ABE